MNRKIPRLVIAGLSGDSGKTIASLSLTAALRRSGLAIAAFKKGPDYIDSAWLTRASGSVCHNLDTFMVGDDIVYRTFVTRATKSDIAVIEGNRGLFDGRDVGGTHSTAQLARLLKAPVILVIDATKATRTVAALVKGCQAFDSNVNIAGVIL
ncbi:MAG: cobyrinic acid a,c-diamide synthase, partial [Candidatus Zixiibacteriota bacterium]